MPPRRRVCPRPFPPPTSHTISARAAAAATARAWLCAAAAPTPGPTPYPYPCPCPYPAALSARSYVTEYQLERVQRRLWLTAAFLGANGCYSLGSGVALGWAALNMLAPAAMLSLAGACGRGGAVLRSRAVCVCTAEGWVDGRQRSALRRARVRVAAAARAARPRRARPLPPLPRARAASAAEAQRHARRPPCAPPWRTPFPPGHSAGLLITRRRVPAREAAPPAAVPPPPSLRGACADARAAARAGGGGGGQRAAGRGAVVGAAGPSATAAGASPAAPTYAPASPCVQWWRLIVLLSALCAYNTILWSDWAFKRRTGAWGARPALQVVWQLVWLLLAVSATVLNAALDFVLCVLVSVALYLCFAAACAVELADAAGVLALPPPLRPADGGGGAAGGGSAGGGGGGGAADVTEECVKALLSGACGVLLFLIGAHRINRFERHSFVQQYLLWGKACAGGSASRVRTCACACAYVCVRARGESARARRRPSAARAACRRAPRASTSHGRRAPASRPAYRPL